MDAVATLDGASAQAIAQHAQLERWRERLIAEDSALTEYLDAFPDSDRQRLRQLIKQVRSASSDAARSKASRALFRTMRDG